MSRFRPQAPSFEEIAGTLSWPVLLRSARLALRPARLGLATILLVLLGLLTQLPGLWLPEDAAPSRTLANLGSLALADFREALLKLEPHDAMLALADLLVGAPLQAFRNAPWSVAAIALPALAVFGILGGAIARLAAEEHALRTRTHWTRALAMALAKPISLATVILAPALVLGLVCVVLALAGRVLFAYDYLDALGGVLYGAALLAGLLVVVLSLALCLGAPMLVPAVVCEGTDAIDAVQRTLAYALARPGRLAVYVLILLLQLSLVVIALDLVLAGAQRLTASTTMALVPDERGEALRALATGEHRQTEPPAAVANPPGTRLAGAALRFWAAVPALALGAYVVSFWFSGGTLLYLTMRRVCDAQDPEELWQPGGTPTAHAEDAGSAGSREEQDDA
jgi:hypothetical protein